MPGRVFFDTNILIYAVAQDDSRAARAEELLAAGGVIGVQILNEFVSVARRKLIFWVNSETPRSPLSNSSNPAGFSPGSLV